MPRSRLLEMEVVGAIVALMVVHDITIFPLEPSVLLLGAYAHNSACLSRAWVSSWHPEESFAIKQLLEHGKDAFAMHPALMQNLFVAHFDQEVCSIAYISAPATDCLI